MCIGTFDRFLHIYGVTQQPETKKYMIVMQYADNGNLLSYLDQNINKLTWMRKAECLKDTASRLYTHQQVNTLRPSRWKHSSV